ncbi:MAG: hypothetical protein J07HX5_01064 [halophilic archaeon J07HX5]|jgi:hypothetical protein|nr:MAG: hypothetical protein J07HX5_01064 [halophilic archaeon J07HX5]
MSNTTTDDSTAWDGDDLLYLIGGVMSAAVAVMFLIVALILTPIFGFAAVFFGYQLYKMEGRTKSAIAVVLSGLLPTVLAVLNPVI